MTENRELPELPPGWSWSVGSYSIIASNGKAIVAIDAMDVWIGNSESYSTDAPIEVVKAVISAWESTASLRNT